MLNDDYSDEEDSCMLVINSLSIVQSALYFFLLLVSLFFLPLIHPRWSFSPSYYFS